MSAADHEAAIRATLGPSAYHTLAHLDALVGLLAEKEASRVSAQAYREAAEARAKQAEQERDEARKWATTMEHERDWERDVVQSEMRSRIEAFEAAAAEIIDAAERGQEHEVDEALSVNYNSSDDCPDRATHTDHPRGYLEHSAWASRMSECHTQHRCPTCGYWAIWRDADGNAVLRAELRPIDHAYDEPTGCLCVPGMPMGCDYPYCSGP